MLRTQTLSIRHHEKKRVRGPPRFHDSTKHETFFTKHDSTIPRNTIPRFHEIEQNRGHHATTKSHHATMIFTTILSQISTTIFTTKLNEIVVTHHHHLLQFTTFGWELISHTLLGLRHYEFRWAGRSHPSPYFGEVFRSINQKCHIW